ncbi:hypothetical protein SDC9_44106 [bioreactor metagenome]|uniref:Uncharacterized protein n=1 Tax=bioreactor metagenome TaxID=1076179 RepID=A0A644W392_9ZZZZ
MKDILVSCLEGTERPVDQVFDLQHRLFPLISGGKGHKAAALVLQRRYGEHHLLFSVLAPGAHGIAEADGLLQVIEPADDAGRHLPVGTEVQLPGQGTDPGGENKEPAPLEGGRGVRLLCAEGQYGECPPAARQHQEPEDMGGQVGVPGEAEKVVGDGHVSEDESAVQGQRSRYSEQQGKRGRSLPSGEDVEKHVDKSEDHRKNDRPEGNPEISGPSLLRGEEEHRRRKPRQDHQENGKQNEPFREYPVHDITFHLSFFRAVFPRQLSTAFRAEPRAGGGRLPAGGTPGRQGHAAFRAELHPPGKGSAAAGANRASGHRGTASGAEPCPLRDACAALPTGPGRRRCRKVLPHLLRHPPEGAAHAHADPEPEPCVDEVSSAFVGSRLLQGVEGAHLLVAVAQHLHLRPLREGFLQLGDSRVLFRDIDGVHEEIEHLHAVFPEQRGHPVPHLAGDLVEPGVDFHHGNFLVDQVGGNKVMDPGEQKPPEMLHQHLPVELGCGPDELDQEFPGIRYADAELAVGAHRQQDAVLRVLELDGRGSAPLHVEGVDPVDEPHPCLEGGFPSVGKVHHLREKGHVGRGQGVPSRTEEIQSLPVPVEDRLLGLVHHELGPRAQFIALSGTARVPVPPGQDLVGIQPGIETHNLNHRHGRAHRLSCRVPGALPPLFGENPRVRKYMLPYLAGDGAFESPTGTKGRIGQWMNTVFFPSSAG